MKVCLSSNFSPSPSLCPPSLPPPLSPVSFSLQDDHRLSDATAVLLSWVERGEVSRRNANHFYSLMQSANGHVRRLMGEKAQQDEVLENAKVVFQSALSAILTQCEDLSVCSGAIVGGAIVGGVSDRVGGAIVGGGKRTRFEGPVFPHDCRCPPEDVPLGSTLA